MKRELTAVVFEDPASCEGVPPSERSRGGSRFQRALSCALSGREAVFIRKAADCGTLQGRDVLFALELDEAGLCTEATNLIRMLRLDKSLMEGCRAVILVDGKSELYTKGIARQLALAANDAGCAFPGRSLVEGTGSLYNFKVTAKNMGIDDLELAYCRSAKELTERLSWFFIPRKQEPRILVVHASNSETSNTIGLWNTVKKHLEGCSVSEVSLRNAVQDCIGCPYTTCLHFSEERSCFFGGPMVDEVYPELMETDALVLLCPNYNDALGANLTAMINRLTALVRTIGFFEKSLFAIVVSGYSGGDIVARQLIGAVSMNKTFALPPRFAMLETANERGSVFEIEDIEEKAAAFAGRIMETLKDDRHN